MDKRIDTINVRCGWCLQWNSFDILLYASFYYSFISYTMCVLIATMRCTLALYLSLFFPASFFPQQNRRYSFFTLCTKITLGPFVRFFWCVRSYLSPSLPRSLSLCLVVYLCVHKFRHCWCAKDDRMMNKVYTHTNTCIRSAIHFKQKWLTAYYYLLFIPFSSRAHSLPLETLWTKLKCVSIVYAQTNKQTNNMSTSSRAHVYLI